MLTVCHTTAAGLCGAMLVGPEVRIGTLLYPSGMAAADLPGYVGYLTEVWAPLWGVQLTIDACSPTDVCAEPAQEVEALDALLSTDAEGGGGVHPLDAVSAVALNCSTDPASPDKVADGFCVSAECPGCNNVGAALLEFCAPLGPAHRLWHTPIAQPTIVRWRDHPDSNT